MLSSFSGACMHRRNAAERIGWTSISLCSGECSVSSLAHLCVADMIYKLLACFTSCCQASDAQSHCSVTYLAHLQSKSSCPNPS